MLDLLPRLPVITSPSSGRWKPTCVGCGMSAALPRCRVSPGGLDVEPLHTEDLDAAAHVLSGI